jgi:hypothetical protein
MAPLRVEITLDIDMFSNFFSTMAIAEFHYLCDKITKIPQFNENKTPLPDYHRDHGVDHPGIQLMITHYLPNITIKLKLPKKNPRRHIKCSLQGTCPEQHAGRTALSYLTMFRT